MGRPKKDPGEGREVTVTTRVKVAARGKIDMLAAASGVTRSEWVRTAIADKINAETTRDR